MNALDATYRWRVAKVELIVKSSGASTEHTAIHFGGDLSIFCTSDQAAALRDAITAHLAAVQYVPPTPAIPEADAKPETEAVPNRDWRNWPDEGPF